MEFTGGGGIVGLNPYGGFVPTNNVVQNQANLDYVNAQNQASLNANNLYGPGGFGYQTNYYSGAGAAYGRATGYYGDTSGLPPGAVTPAQQAANNYQDTGAYADYNSLNPAQQAYYDAHVQKYGYAPSFNNPSLLEMGGGGGGGGPPAPSPPAGPAPPAYSPGGSNTPTDPGEGAAVDFNNLNAAQQSYYTAHVSKYGTAPGAGNSTLTGMADAGGPSSGGGAFTQPATPFAPSGPTASDPTSGGGHPTDPGEGAAVNYADLNPQQQAYYDAHVSKYGTAPGASNSTLTGMADASPSAGGGATPPGSGGPGTSVAPGPFAPGGPTASDPSMGGGHPTDPQEGAPVDYSSLNDSQRSYYDAHVLKYGTAPGANNSTLSGMGATMEEAPPNSPGGLVTAGGFSPTTTIGGGGGGFTHPTDPGEGAAVIYENLNPQQQSYYDAHVQKYGTAPGANNSTLSGMANQGGAPFQSATGNAGQSPGMAPGMGGFNNPAGASTAPTDPGEGATVDFTSLNPQQQAYYNAHVAKYGTAPGANNSTLSGMSNNVGDYEQEAINQGQQSVYTLLDKVNAALNPTAPSSTAPSPAAPAAPADTLTGADRAIGAPTDPQEGAAIDYNSLNPQQKAYADAHLLRYGTLPGANNSTLMGMADATPVSGPGSGVEAINKFAGIDPNTGEQYPPGIDRNTGRPYGVPAPTPGEVLPFTGNPVNSTSIQQIAPGYGSFTPTSARENWLAEQRAPIATQLAADPKDQMQMAARILTEDANNPEGQTAVFEAIVNNQIATGKNMFDGSYYPKPGSTGYDNYQKNLALMQSNPGLFGQMKEIMAKVLQGSNVSQGAFGWSQGGSPQATSDLANANLVYTSPKTGADYNVFYRPTGGNYFGQGNIDKQNYWLSQMPP